MDTDKLASDAAKLYWLIWDCYDPFRHACPCHVGRDEEKERQEVRAILELGGPF